MHKGTLAALAMVLGISIAGNAAAQTNVTADITANTTWSGTIVLSHPIFVKNNAILTILPGTIVRGQPRSTGIQPGIPGTPGSLIITQAGRIIAEGSATNPIIFTTAAIDSDNNGVADDVLAPIGFPDRWDPGNPQPFLDDDPKNAPLAPLALDGTDNLALWGGLAVLGRAPTNLADKCDVGYGKCILEGLTFPGFSEVDATYGGDDPHDNSGRLRFISIRHAGDEIATASEFNGLSLAGVGDGTIVENIEVYCNWDDGIEWFGGTVNGKNLVVSFVGDDMFDADEGYTGTNQFLFGIMPYFNQQAGAAFGFGSGDKATEFDGENYRPDDPNQFDNVNLRTEINSVTDPNDPNITHSDPSPWPLSNPQFYNMTLIGTTLDGGNEELPTSTASANRGAQARNGFAGLIANSVVINTGGTRSGIEVVDDANSPPGYDTQDNATNDRIAVMCTTLDDGLDPNAAGLTVLTNGNDLNLRIGGTAAGNNTVNSVSFSGLVNEDTTFDLKGNPANGKLDGTAGIKVTKINPRFGAGAVGQAGCVAPRGSILDPSATYRGAFLKTATTLWTTPWTALHIGDLLAD